MPTKAAAAKRNTIEHEGLRLCSSRHHLTTWRIGTATPLTCRTSQREGKPSGEKPRSFGATSERMAACVWSDAIWGGELVLRYQTVSARPRFAAPPPRSQLGGPSLAGDRGLAAFAQRPHDNGPIQGNAAP
jgi:hypothetical protein